MKSSKLRVLGLIPARGGSKGIPGKNKVLLAGKPLIAYTIEAALASSILDRLVVSTDDKEIAKLSVHYGAEVPFMRPAAMARDHSGALEVIQHALTTLLANESWRPDWIVYLQPTSPLRLSISIRLALDKATSSTADSLVSVMKVPHQFSLESQLEIVDGRLVPAIASASHPLRRQDKPTRYARNGPAILVTRYETAMQKHSLYGESVLPFTMSVNESQDIDTHEDLLYVEWLMSRSRSTDQQL